VTTHRLLVKDILARMGWRFPVLVLWTALVGMSEGASILLLLPLFNRIGIVTANSQSFGNVFLKETLTLIEPAGAVTILVVIVIVATVQMMLSVGLAWWSVRLARIYQSRRQLELFRAFMRAKWSFFVDRKAGELVNAIITECERLGRAFTLALSLFGSVVVVLIYIPFSLLIAWQPTIIVFVFALATALAMIRFYKKSYFFGQALAPLNAQFQAVLEEQITGAKFIKASGGLDRSIARIVPLVQRLRDINTFASAMPPVIRAVLEYAAFIGVAAILLLTSAGFGVAPGNVLIVLALFARLFPRLTTVQAQLYALNSNVHAIEALDKLQAAAEANSERLDGCSQPLTINKPTVLAARNLQIQLGERVVLDDINVTLRIPGLLAIVGKSGAGKSTLVHALLGLIEPSAGSIQLGPYDAGSVPLETWRRSIGYVPQETILFHASVRDNLTLVNPAASESDIRSAARRAHALEFIDSLPSGFNTIIGDQGVKLSGGQRQRLGIARALLMNPVLLVLDEAMSALDAQSEAELLRTLEELRRQIGVLLVGHRLAAAQTADAVCVFENGRIVESGTWNELMACKRQLYALSQAQSRAENRASVS
jgi:ABC-type multidrug transport system fused ATPase/permease subunit